MQTIASPFPELQASPYIWLLDEYEDSVTLALHWIEGEYHIKNNLPHIP